MSNESRHIDFSETPTPADEAFQNLPEEEQRRLEKCLLFVEEATAAAPGSTPISILPCDIFKTTYYECGGEVVLTREKDSGIVKWKCASCGNEGSVTGYEGNNWDLSNIPEEYARQYIFDKYKVPGEKVEILEGLPFDFDDEEQNAELFNWLDNLDDDQKQEMANLLEKKVFLAEEELERRYAEARSGLTPLQEYRLFIQDWDSPNGPLILRDDLTYTDLEMIYIVEEARHFLQLLQRENSFDLTPEGHLTPQALERILTGHKWRDQIINSLGQNKGELNETDLWLLHITRILLEYAGMVEVDGGKMKPVDEYIHLAEYGYAGQLFKRLFITFFKKLNLSYIARLEDLSFVQTGLPYTLFQLQRLADDWISATDAMRKGLTITTRFELLKSIKLNPEKPEDKMHRLIMVPLLFFDLITSKEKEGGFPEYRKTDLFDRFMEFRF